ncbi:hypothetical protein CFC21_032924 [Triticum aestivum]|uniref:NB-ARC domain-containing protein n=3 Tax=Triticinae TaxID=1648030 RepID=A0A9R1F160_WHEAT|nr:hypothetical protein CFC21_032924 [Triticum aestivum]
MDLAMGAMGSLLDKLGEVIKEEYNLQKGVKKKVKSFSAELDIMRAALCKVAEVPRDQLDDQIKFWANDVRELSYDMEDVVDSLLVRVEGCEPDANHASFKKLMAKMVNMFKKGKARREISTAVEEIHKQLQDVTTRHKMFDFANLPAAKRTTADPFWEVFYGDKKNIIGLDKARDNIIKKISDGNHVSKAHLKILSVVGFGGLGKTTLAREVYDALPTKFDYKAFVSVSRNPDMKKVLSNLLFKLDKGKNTSLHVNAANLDVEQLFVLVRELLHDKSSLDKLSRYHVHRYFIIIDDLWDKEAWKTIRYALQDDRCGSIIITTTRHVEISEECSSSKEDMIHQMKHLSYDDAKKLFYGRIFSSEVCRSGFEDVSTKILKKCAGVPLAIISLASYLANDQRVYQIEQCIFPEDHKISRDRLIRRWISEGFIQVKDETDSLLGLGDSYFNELVNRNMIMPINIHTDGRVEACCVHDIMLDLIFELASGENFVTILDVIEGGTPLEKKFRRLSLQKSMTDLTNAQIATTSMSQVRSFTAFSPAVSMPLPNGFSNLTCLEQLTGHGEGIFTADSAKELGSLFESLSNMQKFGSVEISDVDSWVFQLMLKLDWVPPPNLRRLKLVGVFWNLPTWICSSLLPLLSHLDLTTNRNVQSGDIQILGMLPALQYVTLRVGGLNVHDLLENLVISAGAFPSLRVCLFHNILLMPPTFQPGAMPMVQRLWFGLRVNDILSPDFDLSIRNLPSLKQLRIDLFNNGAGPGDYSQAVDMLRYLADVHPKNPTLRADKFIRERLSRVEPSDEQNPVSSS